MARRDDDRAPRTLVGHDLGVRDVDARAPACGRRAGSAAHAQRRGREAGIRASTRTRRSPRMLPVSGGASIRLREAPRRGDHEVDLARIAAVDRRLPDACPCGNPFDGERLEPRLGEDLDRGARGSLRRLRGCAAGPGARGWADADRHRPASTGRRPPDSAPRRAAPSTRTPSPWPAGVGQRLRRPLRPARATASSASAS